VENARDNVSALFMLKRLLGRSRRTLYTAHHFGGCEVRKRRPPCITVIRTCRRFCQIVPLVLALMGSAICAQEAVRVTKIGPGLLVFATAGGNVVASVGPDGALLVGTPSAASTPEISRILRASTKSRFRYVVIFPEPVMVSQGDAGWGRLGAFVAMQENALRRLGGDVMGAPGSLPNRLVALGTGRPRIAFSEVLAFDLNGEAIHVVHQPPGCSDADAIAHFHVANVAYLGEVFPGDGYPLVDSSEGGKLNGLIDTLEGWSNSQIQIVPARGNITIGTSVKSFVNMILAVRGRVQNMIRAGKTENEILAERPTADFDARWGHGRVSSDEFVREIYDALTTTQK
jgi:cyclase